MGSTHTPLEIVTIGRASVDLYGQQIGTRLEDVGSFAKSVGGCPANIAIGTARLGLKSALLTRVGNEQFGRFIREQLQREGSRRAASRPTPSASPRSPSCRSRATSPSRSSSIATTAPTTRWRKATSTRR